MPLGAWLFCNLIIHSLLICNWALTTRKPPDFRKTNLLFFPLWLIVVFTLKTVERWLLVGFVQCSGTNKTYYWSPNEKHHAQVNSLCLGRDTTDPSILSWVSPAILLKATATQQICFKLGWRNQQGALFELLSSSFPTELPIASNLAKDHQN